MSASILQTIQCCDASKKRSRTSAMLKEAIKTVGKCITCELKPADRRGKFCRFVNARTFEFSATGVLDKVKLLEESRCVTPRWKQAPFDMTEETVRESLNIPCGVVQPGRAHELVFLEVFQPGELEEALDILRRVSPLERPPASDEFVGTDPIRVHLTNSFGLPSYSQFYRALAAGVPMVVSGVDRGEALLTPEFFINDYGSEKVRVINTTTGVEEPDLLKTFMATFRDPSRQVPPLKVKDFPPSMDFLDKFPGLFSFVQDRLTGPSVMTSNGNLNLESSMPVGSNPPDTGPKGYLAHGAAGGVTTHLHCDITDAINICFYAGQGEDSRIGALWTMIHRDDGDRVEDWLRRKKQGSFSGHPVHSQTTYLTADDVQDLLSEGIRVITFIQKQGETVIIPAGVLHQVANLGPCIKIAKDAVAPCNVVHSAKIGSQLRQHRLNTSLNDAQDVLQLNNMAWWFYKRSQTHDLHAARSDPDTNPWTSMTSAAPRYMSAPVTSAQGAATTGSSHALNPAPSDFAAIDFSSDDLMMSGFDTIQPNYSSTAAANTIPGGYGSAPRPPNPPKRPRLVDPSKGAVRLANTRKHNANRAFAHDSRSVGQFKCPFEAKTSIRCSRRTKSYGDREALVAHVIDAHGAYVRFLNEGHRADEISDWRSDINKSSVEDTQFVRLVEDLLSSTPLR